MKHNTGQESRRKPSQGKPASRRSRGQGRRTPGQRQTAGGKKQRALTLACALLAMVMLALCAYIANWYVDRARIRGESERYRAMYNPAGCEETPGSYSYAEISPTPAPSVSPSPTPTAAATPVVSASPFPTPTATATPSPTPVLTLVVTATPEVTTSPAPTPTATRSPSPPPTAAASPVVSASPSPSPTPASSKIPDGDAPAEGAPDDAPGPLVYALPTAPPVQDSFADLLRYNPETVAYLEIDEDLSLPVVQRVNDNAYYLDHDFGGKTAREGTLFLDGINRLAPEDDCLIVYGHNMKNGTMFGGLDRFERVKYLCAHPLIHFDTIYEDRLYVPFAAFTASMNPSNRHYFEVRRFGLDEAGFDDFIRQMQSLSAWTAPVDVRCGDRVLLLVTCDYTNRQGRFILALRQLRPDEDEAGIRALFEGM